MGRHGRAQDAAVTGAEFRARRRTLGASQGDIARRAGSTDTTLRKLEKGQPISDRQRQALWAALAEAEADAERPRSEKSPAEERMLDLMAESLRPVLDELRAFRRLYEDDHAQTGRLADTLEELAARLGEQ